MEKTKYAFNSYLIFQGVLLVIFVCFSVCSANDHEWGMFALFLCFALFALFVILIQPFVISFSSSEIKIIYTLGFVETIPIHRIKKIYKGGSIVSKNNGWPVYVICYPREAKKLFFMNGEIPRTLRTKKLLMLFSTKKVVQS